MSTNIVDTCDAVIKLVDSIASARITPFIFADVEGINLSRLGSISIMQLLVPPAPVVHLIDVFRLQSQVFDTVGTSGKTLKDLLESAQHMKIFFDVRNDSDALFSHYGVELDGVIDLQLIEYASRPRPGRFIKGLAKCISEDCHWSLTERRNWSLVKESGQKLFAPEKGGTYAVFNERPLPQALQDYCVQDVLALPNLLSAYAAKLQPHMASQVLDESRKRISQSQGKHFNGQGSHMALAPSIKWTRPTSAPLLDSPFNILCSTDLSEYCKVQDNTKMLPKEDQASRAVPYSCDLTSEALEKLQQLQIFDEGEHVVEE